MKSAGKGNLIPVYQDILGDTETPVTAYLKIRGESFSYLLESAEGGKNWGRYSFIGYRPNLLIVCRNQEIEITRGKEERILKEYPNPLELLRKVSRQFKPAPTACRATFQGGLVGYVNYELVGRWERVRGSSSEYPDLPEAIFIVPSRLIIFDHLFHKITVVALVHLKEEDEPRSAYEGACQDIDETIDDLKRPLHQASETSSFKVHDVRANFTREGFEEAVRRAKGHIIAGDVIQVVLSQRFEGRLKGDPFSVYRNLRSINPSPYMFYLNYGETKFIGSSPEILVRLKDRRIDLRPIAGTRPRGKDHSEDHRLERELLNCPKERAEHIMLVDLGRNDVGRVALPGSVHATQLMEIERYSHVMHIVSQVEGVLKPGMDPFDLFMSVFPAGTVTGSPKIRAMEIINELEPEPRGPYAGAVGYFGFNGNMDFCITIRTIFAHRDRISIQAGAGIVYDSSPGGEYEETLRKAEAMFKALETKEPIHSSADSSTDMLKALGESK